MCGKLASVSPALYVMLNLATFSFIHHYTLPFSTEIKPKGEENLTGHFYRLLCFSMEPKTCHSDTIWLGVCFHFSPSFSDFFHILPSLQYFFLWGSEGNEGVEEPVSHPRSAEQDFLYSGSRLYACTDEQLGRLLYKARLITCIANISLIIIETCHNSFLVQS